MVGDLGVGGWGQPAQDPGEPHNKLTVVELLALFGRGSEDVRWIATADSQEYLAVVTYLVDRSSHEH